MEMTPPWNFGAASNVRTIASAISTLTKSRFSTLYGHWYPHVRDDYAFATAMLNQCRGTALAMRAIREVQPASRLIQTEDLGKTYSTRKLTYQAEFDNARRWLTHDLLSG